MDFSLSNMQAWEEKWQHQKKKNQLPPNIILSSSKEANRTGGTRKVEPNVKGDVDIINDFENWLYE